jgi:hypothetical protein
MKISQEIRDMAAADADADAGTVSEPVAIQLP